MVFPAREAGEGMVENDGSPHPVFLAPLTLPRSFSRLLYAADLTHTPTDNLNHQTSPPPPQMNLQKHQKIKEVIPALPTFPPLAPLPFPSALAVLLVNQSGRRVGDCDWCLPVPPLCRLCSCRQSSPYSYCCCCCRCCVGATSLYLYRLLCPILAAGVLL